jgi:hypothetical protein
MKNTSQEMESRICTINICGQMKIPMGIFHQITNSSSPATSEPVFMGLTYFQIGFQGRITKLSWKSLANMPLIVL